MQSGPTVFAVWAYVISHQRELDPTDEMLSVELNIPLMAFQIGTTPEDVEKAIQVLLDTDPKTRTEGHEGRRLLHEGGMEYSVPNGRKFRSMRNEKERMVYKREHKRKMRDQKKLLSDVKDGDRRATHGDTWRQSGDTWRHMATTVNRQETIDKSHENQETPSGDLFLLNSDSESDSATFEEYWKLQLTKKGKPVALKSWKRAIAKALPSTIIAGWKAQIESEKADIARGKSGIHPSTWLNGERWDDEVTAPQSARRLPTDPEFAQSNPRTLGLAKFK